MEGNLLQNVRFLALAVQTVFDYWALLLKWIGLSFVFNNLNLKKMCLIIYATATKNHVLV